MTNYNPFKGLSDEKILAIKQSCRELKERLKNGETKGFIKLDLPDVVLEKLKKLITDSPLKPL